MESQIFKKKIGSDNIFNFLDKLCIKTSTYYIFNNCSYKKGTFFDDTIKIFLETIKEYYHKSKIKYLEKKHTYSTFTTIIRQLCNFNKIMYTTEIKYDKSTYEIIYYIFHNTNPNTNN